MHTVHSRRRQESVPHISVLRRTFLRGRSKDDLDNVQIDIRNRHLSGRYSQITRPFAAGILGMIPTGRDNPSCPKLESGSGNKSAPVRMWWGRHARHVIHSAEFNSGSRALNYLRTR